MKKAREVATTKFTEKAPAKINLSLDTPMRYLDGSPRWDNVMATIDLADYVTVETNRGDSKIVVCSDSGFLPSDQRNLAYQAVHVLRSRFHQHDGVKVTIKKNIPVAAGLGGGSADAAAVLRILNHGWNLGLSTSELAKLSLTIDSDVPFCVYNQAAHVTGHGEIINLLPSLPPFYVVLAKPNTSVSTPVILRQINYQRLQHLDNQRLINCIEEHNWQGMCQAMGNVLEPLTANSYPQVAQIKNKMIKLGADAAQMSGTGPTVFALCHVESTAHRIQNALRGFCREVRLVTLLQ